MLHNLRKERASILATNTRIIREQQSKQRRGKGRLPGIQTCAAWDVEARNQTAVEGGEGIEGAGADLLDLVVSHRDTNSIENRLFVSTFTQPSHA